MIPYGRQDIIQADIDAVVEVLRSDFLTQGSMGPRFEQMLVDLCGAKYAVAANSATSALHLACRALGLGPGDWLWTSPNTFVASANCALFCGANVDFVDIDPRTYNMCVDALEAKLEKAEREGRLPKVVVPVHFAGQPCDMARIAMLANKYGFHTIEDASHAIGARYQSETVGNCRYSDITVFSFHPVKIVTTGEGGAALTNNQELASRMSLLRSHGIRRDYDGMAEGSWYYQQIDLGYNYRMTDIQAALGCSQLTRLEQFVQRRHALAARYNELLSDLPITLPAQAPECCSAWHLYVIRVRPSGNITRAQLFSALRGSDIGVNVHYIPVHTQPYYRNLGFKQGDFPLSEAYYRDAITLPLYSGMSDKQQQIVAQTVRLHLTASLELER